jgi:hypothetical protein
MRGDLCDLCRTLLLHWESALVTLTAILALAFLFEGVAEVGAYAMVRNYRNSVRLLPTPPPSWLALC